MNTEIVKKVQDFIEDNNIILEGKVGSERNSEVCTISGYACYVGATSTEMSEVAKLYKNSHIEEDLMTVFNHSKKRNYGLWWEKASNRKKYIIK